MTCGCWSPEAREDGSGNLDWELGLPYEHLARPLPLPAAPVALALTEPLTTHVIGECALGLRHSDELKVRARASRRVKTISDLEFEIYLC